MATGALALCIASVAIYSNMHKDVTIKVDEETIEISTMSTTVGELLNKQGIDLEPEDVVIPGLDVKLENKMEIEIKRAFPVKIAVDGTWKTINTQPALVKQIIEDAGIKLGNMDKSTPALDEFISNENTIQITRVEEKTEEEMRNVPHETISRKSGDLPFGTKKVVQKGEDGQEKVITAYKIEDGKIISKNVTKELVKKPKPEIVMVGTMQVASRAGVDFTYTKKMRMQASAYTYTGRRTATGTQTRVGVVAVDPSIIPLGSRLYIDGYGFCRAEDTGGAIKGNKVDLFLPTREDCRQFGRRWVTVYLLK